MDIFGIAIGLASVCLGIFANKFDNANGRYWMVKSKPAPTWMGKTVFIGIGLIFLISGLAGLAGVGPEQH